MVTQSKINFSKLKAGVFFGDLNPYLMPLEPPMRLVLQKKYSTCKRVQPAWSVHTVIVVFQGLNSVSTPVLER